MFLVDCFSFELSSGLITTSEDFDRSIMSVFPAIFSRVSQYVYVPTRDHLFQTLDLHADTLEGDVKLPLVLLGYEGNNISVLS